jgi:hypothetical protein
MAESLPAAGLFVGQAEKDLFNNAIKQLRSDLGVTMTVHFPPTVSGCPNCFIALDGTSNGIYTDAQNPFGLGQFNKPFPNGGECPVCHGSHDIPTTDSRDILGTLRQWKPKDIVLDPTTKPENVVRTKTGVDSKNDIKRAVKAFIDGEIVVRIRDPVPAGLAPSQFLTTFWEKQD